MSTLFRAFYYDSRPYEGSVQNPISHARKNLATTDVAKLARARIDDLELRPWFAVRLGTLQARGWKLGRQALRGLAKSAGKPLQERDLVPNLTQKGVDMKIGLDVAWTALKKVASIVILVTGDTDFVPIMKFARKEGVTVFLDPLGFQGVARQLKVHADFVFDESVHKFEEQPS